MKVFYILLNICFPYYNVVNPIDTKNQWFYIYVLLCNFDLLPDYFYLWFYF